MLYTLMSKLPMSNGHRSWKGPVYPEKPAERTRKLHTARNCNWCWICKICKEKQSTSQHGSNLKKNNQGAVKGKPGLSNIFNSNLRTDTSLIELIIDFSIIREQWITFTCIMNFSFHNITKIILFIVPAHFNVFQFW